MKYEILWLDSKNKFFLVPWMNTTEKALLSVFLKKNGFAPSRVKATTLL